MDYRQIIQYSLDYIEDNLQAEIHASELAGQAGFSLFHYYRLFQSATGMPVMQYILRRRLLHAIYEVHCGSTGINAALSYGFDTYAGFYKAFQREFGCTPSVFLKSCRAKAPYRINLMKEDSMIVTRKKAAEILKHWNLENEPVSEVYYANTGNKNDNAYAVGDSYILKFTANLGKLKNHIEVSRAIADVGLYAATPVLTGDEREYIQDGELYFYLTRRLPGQQIAPCTLYVQESIKHQMSAESDPYEWSLHKNNSPNARFVGEIIGQLHLALCKSDLTDFPVNDVNLYETVKNWALPKAKEIMHLDTAFWRKYLEVFGILYEKLPRQIIHRDPNPGNIICSENTWGFIDFELSERNVRIYDPCYAAAAVLSETFTQNNPAQLQQWLEIYRNIIHGYDSIVKLTAGEYKAIPYILLANQLICVAWFAEQEKYVELFETNKNMTQWLINNFRKLQFNL